MTNLVRFIFSHTSYTTILIKKTEWEAKKEINNRGVNDVRLKCVRGEKREILGGIGEGDATLIIKSINKS